VSALSELARQSSPSTLVRQLVVLAHPEGVRLLPLARTSQIDLLAVDVTLLTAFAERARQAAQHGDQVLRDFVGMLIDAGNAENALLIAGEPAVSDGPSLFVRGGRWFPIGAFLAVARAGSYAEAVTRLAAVNARSTLALSEAASPDVARVDRTFVVNLLEWLARASRIDPLSTAPLLRVLMLVEAQSRDLRALAWGAVLGTPPSLRLQQLVTPA
jgi:vacuolar-type H+-ATPase subunit C/Vma6